MTAQWTQTELALDRSHHLHHGRAIYTCRFDAVGKFHAPGLAPVRDGDQAWHIDIHGEPAYAARYSQTFGFYEDLAAVEADDGWTHIDIAGRPVAATRHAWCGNFQVGRAPVRDTQGRYFHVDASGAPSYDQRWSYVGDYRDGRAVVQRSDGLHSHIDLRGELVHDRWFVDLDVFHKGHARARDLGGWMHIDELGQAIYAARFTAVEPFYNRQARVEGGEGELLVIDEAGHTLVELRPPRRSAFEAASSDLVGS